MPNRGKPEARQREAQNGFDNVARKWWEWWSIGKSRRHADTVRQRLEEDVFPAFGHKFIDGVTAADVRELMLTIERRDARDVAKRAHETTSQIFRYAIARDVVDARELPELLAKMGDYNGDAITRFAMKLMAYTFVRTSEEIEAPWTQFDLDNASKRDERRAF
jgi:hypothetical protein